MKLVDLNILLYAVNRDADLHARARAWLNEVFWADEPVGLSWVVLLGVVSR